MWGIKSEITKELTIIIILLWCMVGDCSSYVPSPPIYTLLPTPSH